MGKLISIGISVAVLSVVITSIAGIWITFEWPTLYGFWNIVIPAILALSQIPIIGTFVSIISWVVTFELVMFLTRLVLWLASAIHGMFEPSISR